MVRWNFQVPSRVGTAMATDAAFSCSLAHAASLVSRHEGIDGQPSCHANCCREMMELMRDLQVACETGGMSVALPG